MNPRLRRWLSILLGVAIVLALVWDRIPLADASARLARLPEQGLGFASREIPLNDAERSIYGTAKVTKRLYQLGREQWVVVVIDGTANRHAIHDPTYCFRGGGWNVLAQEPLAIPGGEAAHLTLGNDREQRQALYWISDGRTRHASPTRYWRQTALRRLTLGQSGPEPVLVLVQPNRAGAVAWDQLPNRLPALFDL